MSMRCNLRRRYCIAALLVAGSICLDPAAAQTYPSRVIKMIVPVSVGSQPDVLARLFAQLVSTEVGTTIVDNRPGANTTLGTKAAADADPDGHTLLYASPASLALAPALNKSPGYDPVKSFAPIATFSTSPFILFVGKSVPESVKTIEDFIVYVKERPGKLNYAANPGSPPHIAGELFKRATGLDIVLVPYRSLNQAFSDIIGGQMDAIFDGPAPMMPLLADGKMRALVSLGARRSTALPNVRIMKEAGLADVQLETWNGLVAPAGTPPAIVTRLNKVINDGLNTDEMKTALRKYAVDPFVTTPEHFAALIARDSQKWQDIVTAANVKLE
jgi:tripartite-type tricarboxylate transporter receptor subunit TctC